MLKERIAVLMSGGVDSSVAAALLKEQGHDPIGLTYNIGPSRVHGIAGSRDHGSRCCGMDDMTDAATIASQLGIPHYVLNVRDSFARGVIGDFVESYLKGETPLPCAHCNTRVKWGEMADRAREMGASRMATGHYAKVDWDASRGRHVLKRAMDLEKDQSYFLFGLSQEQLASAIFPLGDLTKPEVRERAEALGLVVSDKKDSQELCFVSSGHYSEVIAPHASRLTPHAAGEIVDVSGAVLGTHDGFFKFTVGQRRGLGLNGGPYYVKSIDSATRKVVVGNADSTLTDSLTARDPNLIGYESWESVGRVRARVRYRHKGEWGSVRWDGQRLKVEFENPVRAVAPGQAVVFYREDEIVGGAWITPG
ncbi:MAG: tRNA 2-thiouridine(34) synthase MnmA [Nitrospirae bacterium]|nr:tRNA 2-thiouridine(34) synthase MnmA [Nitrospirota bacterium]